MRRTNRYWVTPLIYTVFSAFYILFSDHLVELFITDSQEVQAIQSLKGVIFVVCSGTLIFVLVYLHHRKTKKYEKILENSLDLYQSIYQNFPIPGFFIYEHNFEIFSVNRAFKSKAGIPENTEVKGSLKNFLNLDDPDILDRAFHTTIQNGLTELDFTTAFNNGEKRRIALFLQPMNLYGNRLIFGSLINTTESLESEGEYLDRVLEYLDRERIKISSDIHDGIQQYFALIKMLSYTLDDGGMKEQILEVAQKGINDSRSLAHSVAPAILTTDLKSMAENLAYGFREVGNLNVSINCSSNPKLTSEELICIHRFLQEGMTNIVKHSKASLAEINIDVHQNKLQVSLQDDGVGFDLAEMQINNKGLGMNLLRTRAQMIQGDFLLNSVKGKGTKLILTLSLTDRIATDA